MSKHVDRWLDWWRRGDTAMILSSVTDDFVHDDAVDGRITRAEFAAYLERLFAAENTPGGFETINDVVTVERDGVETMWGWWTTLATPMEGAGLVKARGDGVFLERVSYCTRPVE